MKICGNKRCCMYLSNIVVTRRKAISYLKSPSSVWDVSSFCPAHKRSKILLKFPKEISDNFWAFAGRIFLLAFAFLQNHAKKCWWTRSLPIRTTAEIRAHIKVLPAKHPYLYQKLAQKANELRLLGMSYTKIGKLLGIDPKTAIKAVRNYREGK